MDRLAWYNNRNLYIILTLELINSNWFFFLNLCVCVWKSSNLPANSGRKLAPVCTERCTIEVGFSFISLLSTHPNVNTAHAWQTHTIHNEALDIKGFFAWHTCPNHCYWGFGSWAIYYFLLIFFPIFIWFSYVTPISQHVLAAMMSFPFSSYVQ